MPTQLTWAGTPPAGGNVGGVPVAATAPPPPWHAPVSPVAIVRAYREVPPFLPGGHRGIDLRAIPGGAVRAPCAGRVSFRGAVAGGPPTITIDCGALRATLQRVAPAVGLGEAVGRGARIGSATEAALDLSARRADGSYLDPATLLAVHRSPGSPVVTRRTGRPRSPRPGLPKLRASRPAKIADRALVNAVGPRQATGAAPASAAPSPRVDRPLGLAGSALAALVLLASAVAAWRGRRRTLRAATGDGLARAQR